eukprot:1143713-Pelagomonas_calceolata.AAC.3
MITPGIYVAVNCVASSSDHFPCARFKMVPLQLPCVDLANHKMLQPARSLVRNEKEKEQVCAQACKTCSPDPLSQKANADALDGAAMALHCTLLIHYIKKPMLMC